MRDGREAAPRQRQVKRECSPTCKHGHRALARACIFKDLRGDFSGRKFLRRTHDRQCTGHACIFLADRHLDAAARKERKNRRPPSGEAARILGALNGLDPQWPHLARSRKLFELGVNTREIIGKPRWQIRTGNSFDAHDNGLFESRERLKPGLAYPVNPARLRRTPTQLECLIA